MACGLAHDGAASSTSRQRPGTASKRILLAEMSRLQDEAERARTHTAQVATATAEWSARDKQGCSDMIKATAALHRGSA